MSRVIKKYGRYPRHYSNARHKARSNDWAAGMVSDVNQASIKIETSERRLLWHKKVSIAVLSYNTSYHTSISCEPSRAFHGRIPYSFWNLKLENRPQQAPIPTSQFAQEFLD